jgi:hypothetical protein
MTIINTDTHTDIPESQSESDVAVQGVLVSRKREDLFAIFLLLIVLFFCYRDIVFDNKTFLQLSYTAGTMPYSSGISAYGYPSSAEKVSGYPADPGAIGWANEPYIRRAPHVLAQGEFPLWNPNQGLGEPYMADGNSGVFEPIQLAFYVIPEQLWPYAIDVQVLLRFLISGIFTYLFARELGLPWLPAVFAGASYMLSSYFIAFGNHPQMRAETLLPLALYTYERLAQRRTIARFLLVSGTTAWIIVASFPESGFLALAIAGLWYSYRAFWQSKQGRFDWRSLGKRLARMISAATVGILLAAFFWLPLIENIQNSLHTHEGATGLGSLPAVYAVLSIVRSNLPDIVWTPHFYITMLALAIIGIGSAFSKRADRYAILFFGVYGVALYLKIYGFPLVQWIGYLPGFSQIQMTKYTVPSISFCFSIVGAFGIDTIVKKRAPIHWLLIFLILTFFVLYFTAKQGGIGSDLVMPVIGALIFFTIAFTVYKLSVFFYSTQFNGWYVPLTFIILIALEPSFWFRQVLRPVRYDPYTEPNFIHFLKSQNPKPRIFGYDRIVQPGVATAYNLDDIRFLGALVSERRYLYVNQFIIPSLVVSTYLMQPGASISRETVKRIAHVLSTPGNEGVPNTISLVDYLTKFQGIETPIYLGKYTDLINTKYILAPPNMPVAQSANLLDILTITADKSKALKKQGLTIGSEMRIGFLLPPPSKAPFDIILPSGKLSLQFAIGLDPASWMQAGIPGSGTVFKLTVEDQQGEHEVFARTLDPKAAPADQKWIDASVDLSRWSGQHVKITMITDPGKQAIATSAPAFWATPVLRVEDDLTPWALQNLTPIKTVDITAALLDNNQPKQGTGFDMGSAELDGQRRNTIYMQTEHFADLDLQVPQSGAKLTFGIGVDPSTWKEAPAAGVEFMVTASDGTASTDIYTYSAKPGEDVNDQHWIDAQADLSAWSGRKVRLRFSTKADPQGTTSDYLAYWSNIQLNGDGIAVANPELARFQLIYNDEVAIYQNNFAYPRAFVVPAVTAVQDVDQAIREMARSGFNPAIQAVVEGEIPSGWSQPLASQELSSPGQAAIVKQTNNTMHIQATLDRPGLLVVSESYAPGWQAYVDGQPAPIVPTDIFLRGVYLDAGTHEITFTYAPRSFTIGAAISITTLGAILISCSVIAIARRKQYRKLQ